MGAVFMFINVNFWNNSSVLDLPAALTGIVLIALPHVLTRLYIWPIIMIRIPATRYRPLVSPCCYCKASSSRNGAVIGCLTGQQFAGWGYSHIPFTSGSSCSGPHQKPPSLAGIWWLGLWAIPLLVVAVISYYGLERTLLNLRNRYRQVAAQPPRPVTKPDAFSSIPPARPPHSHHVGAQTSRPAGSGDFPVPSPKSLSSLSASDISTAGITPHFSLDFSKPGVVRCLW